MSDQLERAAQLAELRAARFWEQHLDRRQASEPPAMWIQGLPRTTISAQGYVVFNEDGPPTTCPCTPRQHIGTCEHEAVVAYFAPTKEEARFAAQCDLMRARAHDGLGELKRRIHPFTAELDGYDLSEVLTADEAEFVRWEINQNEWEEARSWKLAKQADPDGDECEGFVIPTEPQTLFCYSTTLGESVLVEDPVGEPVVLPLRSPQGALDFVRHFVLQYAHVTS